MGDSLRTGKPSQYITNTKANSAFHSFRVGKLSTDLSGCGGSETRLPVSGDRFFMCSHMAGDAV